MIREITITNGETIKNTGVSVFDEKNQPVTTLPEGWTIEYANSNEEAAQVVQDDDKDIVVDITTKGDKTGDSSIQANVKNAEGKVLLDQDGTPPVLLVHVINSKPNTATWTPGTVEPE